MSHLPAIVTGEETQFRSNSCKNMFAENSEKEAFFPHVMPPAGELVLSLQAVAGHVRPQTAP